MKKKRHTPEQIVRMLRRAEAKLAAGTTLPEGARELGISESTFYCWRKKYRASQPIWAQPLRSIYQSVTTLS